MRRHPHLYETNARVFLRRLSDRCRRDLRLSQTPDEEWQRLAGAGFDLLWLMGVWQRSPRARQAALAHPGLRQEYDTVLPGWNEDDVGASPYAVYGYNIAPELGQPGELGRLKSTLNRHGLGLVLDFVPNHLAMDHPWTASRPELFVHGTAADVGAHPDWFFSPGNSIHLAYGRDPYFPPWTDTVQANLFSTELRRALIGELLRLAEEADGVRCDMAMLALSSVFERVWGSMVKDRRPTVEFWTEAISEVRRRRPGFIFVAEAYWGLERELQQLGFDYTYDKVLYDRLRYGSAGDVLGRLTASAPYQEHSVRFIENHDEPRAISAFGRDRSLAAAAIVATVPGLRLFHEGQLEGRKIRVPVQLVRWPKEEGEPELQRFYERLLACCDARAFHDGDWSLVQVDPGKGDPNSHQGLLAWAWRYAGDSRVVAINYSASPAQGSLRLALPETAAAKFRDELTGVTYAAELRQPAEVDLALDFAPWQAAILTAAR